MLRCFAPEMQVAAQAFRPYFLQLNCTRDEASSVRARRSQPPVAPTIVIADSIPTTNQRGCEETSRWGSPQVAGARRDLGFRNHRQQTKVVMAGSRTPLPHRVMQIQNTLDRLANLYGHSDESELLRIALLISLRVESLASLDDQELELHYHEAILQLQSATDQHAAVSEELDQLASTQPCEFSPDHVWTLVRAIKVQSRCLSMYLGKVLV